MMGSGFWIVGFASRIQEIDNEGSNLQEFTNNSYKESQRVGLPLDPC
jgi:hypothetical protein